MSIQQVLCAACRRLGASSMGDGGCCQAVLYVLVHIHPGGPRLPVERRDTIQFGVPFFVLFFQSLIIVGVCDSSVSWQEYTKCYHTDFDGYWWHKEEPITFCIRSFVYSKEYIFFDWPVLVSEMVLVTFGRVYTVV